MADFLVCVFSPLIVGKSLSFYNNFNNELLHCKTSFFYVIL